MFSPLVNWSRSNIVLSILDGEIWVDYISIQRYKHLRDAHKDEVDIENIEDIQVGC